MRGLRRLDQRLAVGETEVVVGAQVEHALAAGHLDLAGLARGDDALVLVQAGRAQGLELARQVLGESLAHGMIRRRGMCTRSGYNIGAGAPRPRDAGAHACTLAPRAGGRRRRSRTRLPAGADADTPPGLRRRVAAVAPMLAVVVPFGMIAGLSAMQSGFSAAQAMTLSATVFAGASQLATVQLVADGAVPAVIVLTALTINLRMMMYSASLAPHFQHLGSGSRLGLAYFLVDQNYALAINRYNRPDGGFEPWGHWYYLGGGVALWLTWQSASAVGVFLGAGIPRDWSLDFAVPLVFLVLLMPALRDRAHVVAALVGGVVATAGTGLPLKLGIVTGALSGIAAGYAFERWAGAQR
ncbi:MAG: AzlC family ABC transporter permease [Halofilum sp. (in: g-proteobacteria)]|nr:AzlC family ABC transporter permease [Halofilum sp. (in: g-proteobacteria)]